MTKAHRVKAGTFAAPAAPATQKSDAVMRARSREHITSLPQSEFNIGPFVVRCSNKQHYRLYSIFMRPDMLLLGRQASYPSIFDCLDKLEKAYGAGTVPSGRYENILNSRSVAQELAARSAA